MNQDIQTTNLFTDEQISQISGLFDIFKRIHERLIREGYTIKEGKFIPPSSQ